MGEKITRRSTSTAAPGPGSYVEVTLNARAFWPHIMTSIFEAVHPYKIDAVPSGKADAEAPVFSIRSVTFSFPSYLEWDSLG